MPHGQGYGLSAPPQRADALAAFHLQKYISFYHFRHMSYAINTMNGHSLSRARRKAVSQPVKGLLSARCFKTRYHLLSRQLTEAAFLRNTPL